MTTRTTTAQVRAFAARLGLTCETSNPGDGVRRFEFTFNTSPTTTHAAYCYGAREAYFWLMGFERGQETERGAAPLRLTDDEIRSLLLLINDELARCKIREKEETGWSKDDTMRATLNLLRARDKLAALP